MKERVLATQPALMNIQSSSQYLSSPKTGSRAAKSYSRTIHIPIPEAVAEIGNNYDSSIPFYVVVLDDETKTAALRNIGFWVSKKNGEDDYNWNIVPLDSITIPRLIETTDSEGNQVTYTLDIIGGWSFRDGRCLTALSYPIKKITIPNSVSNIYFACGTNQFGEEEEYEWSNFSPAYILEDYIYVHDDAQWYVAGFLGNPVVERVTLPEDIMIGPYAFTYCRSLKNVNLPESLETIRPYWFYDCTSLDSIRLPESVESIGELAFANCSSMSKVNLPPVKIIGKEAFYNNKLTAINLTDSITSIGDNAFANNLIEELTLPSSLASLGNGAFYGCPISKLTINSDELGAVNSWATIDNLTEVIFGDNVTKLSSLSGLTNLKKVTLPSTLTEIPNSQFRSCSSLENIELPTTITSIGDNAFSECCLTEVTLPSVRTIGNNAFYNNKLTAITLSDSITSIGTNAFANNLIEELTLPSSLTSLGNGAFYGCPISKLTVNVGINGTLSPWFNTDNLTEVVFGDNVTKLAILSGLTNLKKVTLPSTLTEIPNSQFRSCSSLENIELPTTITSIGDDAFSECCLTEVTLPSVRTIGNNAFYNNKLTAINLTDSLTSIGTNAFANNLIDELSLPSSLTSLGNGAFYGCPISKLTLNVNVNGTLTPWFTTENLTEVVFGDNVTKPAILSGASNLKKVTLPSTLEVLPDNALSNCSSLEEVNLPTTLHTIGNRAFALNYSLKALALPESLRSIGENAFRYCRSINRFDLSDEITEIGSYAFADCDSLTSIHLPASMTYIADGLFSKCENLESVEVGEKVKSIGEGVFAYCPKLTTVNIPEGVTNIRQYVFNGCSSLPEIKLPNSISTIDYYAFASCSNLAKIELGTNLFEISDCAFVGCNNLNEIKVNAPIPPYAEKNTFPSSIYETAKVIVPEQSLKLYTRENPWNRFRNYLTMNNGVSLSHYEVEMAGDEVFQLGVYNNKNEIAWSSSNPDVAYVNDCGLIVAMGQTGATQIAANVDGETLNCRVLVTTPTRGEKLEMRKARRISGVTDIEDIEPVDIKIESIKGEPLRMNIRLNPVGACTVIDWRTSDDSLATIENGFVTIIGNGEVEFAVETENGLEDRMMANTGEFITGIDEVIFSENDILTVYDLTGRCLIANGSLDQFKHLNKGIYIVNGKKVVVK